MLFSFSFAHSYKEVQGSWDYQCSKRVRVMF